MKVKIHVTKEEIIADNKTKISLRSSNCVLACKINAMLNPMYICGVAVSYIGYNCLGFVMERVEDKYTSEEERKIMQEIVSFADNDYLPLIQDKIKPEYIFDLEIPDQYLRDELKCSKNLYNLPPNIINQTQQEQV